MSRIAYVNKMICRNSINGVPACANKRLLTDLLRDEWGFPGYVISDEGAIEWIEAGHLYTKNAIETAAVAVAAGTDHDNCAQRTKTF